MATDNQAWSFRRSAAFSSSRSKDESASAGSGSAEAGAALSRQGRYKDVAGNLKVKEVRIAEDERFVICHNPEAAERDAAIRARMIAQLKELIDGADTLSQGKRAELRGVISAKPGLNRYLRGSGPGTACPGGATWQLPGPGDPRTSGGCRPGACRAAASFPPPHRAQSSGARTLSCARSSNPSHRFSVRAGCGS